MPRKPSDVTQIKIRVREDLRRRLEQAAKKHDVSINAEMTSRLASSFELPELSKITAGLARATNGLTEIYVHLGEELLARVQQEKLIAAAEKLVSELPAEIRERQTVRSAIEQLEKAIAVITARIGREPIHEQE
jgi:predicted transcriptional regulator